MEDRRRTLIRAVRGMEMMMGILVREAPVQVAVHRVIREPARRSIVRRGILDRVARATVRTSRAGRVVVQVGPAIVAALALRRSHWAIRMSLVAFRRRRFME